MKPFSQARRKLTRVADRLQEHYPVHNLNNQSDPTDEAVFISLTTQTNHSKFLTSWRAVRKEFPAWELLLKEEAENTLRELLQPAGLASQKARLITEMAGKIASERGAVDLSFLKDEPTDAAELYLVSLPGFALKTARCVLMYSLDRTVFPLDIHCYRIMQRLGILNGSMPYHSKKTHDYAQDCVYPKDRYRVHVLMVQHGRAICRSTKPKCSKCSLFRSCRNKGEPVRI
jgi:endonuclease III